MGRATVGATLKQKQTEVVPRPKAEIVPQGAAAPTRQFQELWFSLARHEWRSIVLVPADEGGSSADAARGLAEVGKQLHELPVTLFIMADPSDYWTAVQLVHTAASDAVGTDAANATDYASAVQVVASAARTPHGPGGRTPAGKVIIAVQPVVAEPLGLAVTQAADLVLLHVRMGQTRTASARRSIELIGRDRIVGCLLDHTH